LEKKIWHINAKMNRVRNRFDLSLYRLIPVSFIQRKKHSFNGGLEK